MASDTEDAEMAARRLKSALDRIARLAARAGGAGAGQFDLAPETAQEIRHRLDAMIERLRAALNGTT